MTPLEIIQYASAFGIGLAIVIILLFIAVNVGDVFIAFIKARNKQVKDVSRFNDQVESLSEGLRDHKKYVDEHLKMIAQKMTKAGL